MWQVLCYKTCAERKDRVLDLKVKPDIDTALFRSPSEKGFRTFCCESNTFSPATSYELMKGFTK